MSNFNGIDLSQLTIKEQLASTGKSANTTILTYEQTLEKLKDLISDAGIKYVGQNLDNYSESDNAEIKKDKVYYRGKIEYYKENIRRLLLDNKIKVVGYTDKKTALISYQSASVDYSLYYYDNEYTTNDIDKMKEEDEAVEQRRHNKSYAKAWNDVIKRDKDIDDLVEELAYDTGGLKAISPLLNDNKVSDIFILSWNMIYVERDGLNRLYKATFRSHKEYLTFLEHFLAENGKKIDKGNNKVVDFEVYGNRGCGVDNVVTPRDTSLTIRIHPESHITLSKIMKFKGLNEEQSEFFRLILKGECNLIYAGLTGSGKTTTIRALLDEYIPQFKRRVMVCEDTQELFLENPHTLEFISYKHGDPKLAVPLQNLIFIALRQKPKYIIVGEVRAEEAQAAVEGMETGHSTIFTMHGGKPINCINRLVTKYLVAMPSLGIEVVERIIGEAVDYIAIQDNIPGIGRRITSISEISYDYEKRTIDIKTIFKFDFEINDYIRMSGLHPDKVSKMLARGVTYDELRNGKFYDWTDFSEYTERNGMTYKEKENHPYYQHIIG